MKVLDYRVRVAELALGLSVNKLLSIAFDWILYPMVILWLGILMGGALMTFLSFLACLAMIRFYDWSKRDWIGIETIKDIKTYTGQQKGGRAVSWILSKSDPVIFLFASIWYDPFITTAYLRHGAHQYNGMSGRDWKIFIGSLIIGNAYWTLACFMGITLFEWAWRVVAG